MDKITIIVPVYNAENTIERCLASFISNRDYIQEVILVNDRSTDRTFEKIDQFRTFFDIRVIDNEGVQGPGPGRKTGMLAANTEWITFVDADDCLTPNSLSYVAKQIDENPEIVLLHTQTVYYESGNFVKEHTTHSDLSCGGNFYKLAFLLDHELYPHDSLFMAEDEYFNYIVIRHIDFYNDPDALVKWYDYPVYEVHHDIERELSFSSQSWADYACKWHLLGAKYRLQFFEGKPDLIPSLRHDFLGDFIFCYFIFQGLLQEEASAQFVNQEETLLIFRDLMDYGESVLGIQPEGIIHYYYHYRNRIKLLHAGACDSIGIIVDKSPSFKRFVNNLKLLRVD